ncbi:MAG: hypothetical protein K2M34_02930 [Alphaproteobacteria bacterium]|nr:hypothetical protein [Alphaproteobacteria bacterium]
MKILTFVAIAMSVGIWTQYAAAEKMPAYGSSMTAEQLAANNCTEGYIQGGCTDPVYWSVYDGWEEDDCKNWMSVFSCSKCKSGYALSPYTCMPDNTAGTWYRDCMPSMMSDAQKSDARFAYTCTCSDLYSETGKDGYLFRGCSTGSLEFKCDASKKYYQSSTSKKPTCTVTQDANGNFTFKSCSGCKLCNETAETWKVENTGYQRAYKNVFTNGDPATCVATAQNKWQCAPGRYGTTTNGTSGCNICPTLESSGLTPVCSSDTCPYVTSPAGATKISDCYATTYEPSLGISVSDATGVFHWVDPEDDAFYGKCNYQ